jgi:hypothetical protein
MQSVNTFFDSDGFDQEMNVSATTRKFQSSVVVKQDPNKSGILAFLKEVETQSTPRPQRTELPTQRPRRRQGGY